jgi:hypothetical protein
MAVPGFPKSDRVRLVPEDAGIEVGGPELVLHGLGYSDRVAHRRRRGT